jgi:hypothetical protein
LALPDAVALIVASVNTAFVISLESVECSFLAQVCHGLLDFRLGDRAIDEQRCWDGVEVSTGKWTIEKSGTVG